MEISNNNNGNPININATKQGTKTIPPPYSVNDNFVTEEQIKGRLALEH
jgi:hypothetical protein